MMPLVDHPPDATIVTMIAVEEVVAAMEVVVTIHTATVVLAATTIAVIAVIAAALAAAADALTEVIGGTVAIGVRAARVTMLPLTTKEASDGHWSNNRRRPPSVLPPPQDLPLLGPECAEDRL